MGQPNGCFIFAKTLRQAYWRSLSESTRQFDFLGLPCNMEFSSFMKSWILIPEILLWGNNSRNHFNNLNTKPSSGMELSLLWVFLYLLFPRIATINMPACERLTPSQLLLWAWETDDQIHHKRAQSKTNGSRGRFCRKNTRNLVHKLSCLFWLFGGY